MIQAKENPKLKQAMIEGAKEADERLVKPLFQFHNYGQQLPYNWSTISNESAFGTDYYTRTAVAKSNILVNSPNETKYFYQDFDANGEPGETIRFLIDSGLSRRFTMPITEPFWERLRRVCQKLISRMTDACALAEHRAPDSAGLTFVAHSLYGPPLFKRYRALSTC